MDREAWHAVAKSWTLLSDWTELSLQWYNMYPYVPSPSPTTHTPYILILEGRGYVWKISESQTVYSDVYIEGTQGLLNDLSSCSSQACQDNNFHYSLGTVQREVSKPIPSDCNPPLPPCIWMIFPKKFKYDETAKKNFIPFFLCFPKSFSWTFCLFKSFKGDHM